MWHGNKAVRTQINDGKTGWGNSSLSYQKSVSSGYVQSSRWRPSRWKQLYVCLRTVQAYKVVNYIGKQNFKAECFLLMEFIFYTFFILFSQELSFWKKKFWLMLMWLCVLKVIVNSKIRILSLFTHLHGITSSHGFE